MWRIDLHDDDPRSPWVAVVSSPRGQVETYGQDTLAQLVDGIIESIDTDPVYGLGATLRWTVNGGPARGQAHGVELPK